MRLNKFLAQAGIASRRKTDKLIQMATTTVNGELCLNPAYKVKDTDIVRYDDQIINYAKEKIVILLHKPRGVITTVKDTHGRKTVLDLIPNQTRLVPVGRLDKNTTGVLLMSNDGNLHEYLTHPKNQIPKDYEVVIEGRMTFEQIERLKRGIYIGNQEYSEADVLKQHTVKQRSTVILRLRQGKKREIRRIMYRLKRKLFSLKRICFAGLDLGGLSPGQYRILTAGEVQMLKKSFLPSKN